MSSGLLALRRVATSLSNRPLLLRRVVALRPATTPAVTTRFFSAEPIVPGVGKGKTSTGYVSAVVATEENLVRLFLRIFPRKCFKILM